MRGEGEKLGGCVHNSRRSDAMKVSVSSLLYPLIPFLPFGSMNPLHGIASLPSDCETHHG